MCTVQSLRTRNCHERFRSHWQILILTAIAFYSFTGLSLPMPNLSPVPKLGNGELIWPQQIETQSDKYRIGDEWGKQEVTDELLNKSTSAKRAAFATTRTGGATGFVLGEFSGHIVIATNHHVCPSKFRCSWGRTEVPFLDVYASIDEFIGSWPEIDLALYTIEVSDPEKRSKLNAIAANFDFDSPVYKGQELITVGFGVASNPNREMVLNMDSDCKVFSRMNDFRQISDPDDLNPAPYQAWSFANGCDVSHGDSGSAMVDKNSGRPVGIIWTGRIPKNPEAQSSAQLQRWLDDDSEKVWQELSYAVPAPVIYEYLLTELKEGRVTGVHAEILQDILQDTPNLLEEH